MLPPFVSTRHFLDLMIFDNDTKTKLMQELVKEKYYITKYAHTSYLDLDEVTYFERNMILKFITEEKEQEQQQLQRLRHNT